MVNGDPIAIGWRACLSGRQVLNVIDWFGISGKYVKKNIAKETSPPWRGEFGNLSAAGNWGGLFNSEQEDNPDSYRDVAIPMQSGP